MKILRLTFFIGKKCPQNQKQMKKKKKNYLNINFTLWKITESWKLCKTYLSDIFRNQYIW